MFDTVSVYVSVYVTPNFIVKTAVVSDAKIQSRACQALITMAIPMVIVKSFVCGIIIYCN